MATFNVATIDTGHEDMIHDAQMDFLGTKLATCSCDKNIRIFDLNVQTGTHTFVAELKGHEGPVWQLAWAHPRFDTLLASCSYDRRVIIWKEVLDVKHDGRKIPKWEPMYTYEGHESSVNSVCWAPPEWGLMLAAGSSDGTISVLSYVNDRWEAKKIPSAHTLGCNAVTWSPPTGPSSMSAGDPGSNAITTVKRFASGGCDNLVKIWKEENEEWTEETKLEGHSDWVRDVAWSPSAGLTKMKIASCSQDRRVIVWNNRESDGVSWTPELLHVFDDVVWHVSWNFVGDVLAVSGGDNQVSLWKKRESESWECISDSSKSQQQQHHH
uniref:Protein SEC13 homolog n=1 Tax=Folsomia candida TaxID=158441 RepID=A0A481SZV8_FOLCA|nr:protein transport protein sec13 [Folsomia candida]